MRKAADMLGVDLDDFDWEKNTDSTLKRQYWKMARREHPDAKGGDRYRFVELQAALELLRQEAIMRRHKEEEWRRKRQRDRLNEKIRQAHMQKDAEKFQEIVEKFKSKQIDMDATTLYRVLDGTSLIYDIDTDPAHLTHCLSMIRVWEDATGLRAHRDVYHQVLITYQTECDDSFLIHRAMHMVLAAMARRGVELDNESIKMLRHMVRRAGRMGALGGEGSSLRM